MQNAFIVLNQVMIMALIAVTGFLLVKGKKLEPKATASLSNLLVYAVTPCVILNAMQREFKLPEARALLVSFIITALCYVVVVPLAHLFVRGGRGNKHVGLEHFSLTMPNAGYIGIPMVQAVLGADGVFYLTAYIVIFNLMMFSYGRYQLARDGGAAKGLSREALKKCVINPATISVTVGAVLYITGIAFPAPAATFISWMTGLNSVISMLLIGVFLAQTDFRSLLHFSRGFVICLLRLVVMPAAVIAMLLLVDFSSFTEQYDLVRTTVLIASCGPVAVAAAFMAELCGADNLYGAKLVTVSTLMSVATMPLTLLVWDFLTK